ncbi:medium-chain acyl-[acyl-carrier-protein] hydrolase [Lactobacillus colini]|uniref:Medium-chain acyl-[acyl-carrier-protein] hydrolase n=1 Tax=Lactobacillus colini TaxID=1819254 RepID=A0ABS4MGT7_9LACO|nr:acyl-ACP thioesterase domain-containing protein [Lactobacillus colini]MBP2058534.1 medium-chain acyl-[acyl-carrier-protein] hydrolase [Lactobacillus colini]
MKDFKQEKVIDYGNCDEEERLELPFLVEYMMEVSNKQLDNEHAGINDLMERGLGWVVLDYDFTIHRLPRAGERVVFTTKANGYNRIFCYRDFSVEDLAGKKLVEVRSQWVMLDLATRRVVAPDPAWMKELDNPPLDHLPRFKKARPLREWDNSQSYSVRYYDLDTNHHLTNSRYFDWIIDALPREFLNTHEPVSLNITFKKEVKYRQEAQSLVKIDMEKLTTDHEIRNSNDVAALAKIVWRKN